MEGGRWRYATPLPQDMAGAADATGVAEITQGVFEKSGLLYERLKFYVVNIPRSFEW
jgi:hypothetical protein